MNRFLQYVRFLLVATNQHGVHSPFIYAYVTKCLYAKSRFKGSKAIDILLKSIDYFKVKKVWLPQEEKNIEEIISKQFSRVHLGPDGMQIIYLSVIDPEVIAQLLRKDSGVENDTLLLIGAIHENEYASQIWEQVKKNEKVRVTVDMFFCGAVFFRREQVKEHFKIRI